MKRTRLWATVGAVLLTLTFGGCTVHRDAPTERTSKINMTGEEILQMFDFSAEANGGQVTTFRQEWAAADILPPNTFTPRIFRRQNVLAVFIGVILGSVIRHEFTNRSPQRDSGKMVSGNSLRLEILGSAGPQVLLEQGNIVFSSGTNLRSYPPGTPGGPSYSTGDIIIAQGNGHSTKWQEEYIQVPQDLIGEFVGPSDQLANLNQAVDSGFAAGEGPGNVDESFWARNFVEIVVYTVENAPQP